MDDQTTSTRELFTKLRNKVLITYQDPEASAITSLILEKVTGLSRNDLIIKQEVIFTEVQQDQLRDILSRLQAHEPVQYILEEAWFYSRKYLVNPHVLIPRMETEELVSLVIKENQFDHPKILEIGSGSGCIIISLALELENSKCTATDLFKDTLNISSQNAKILEASVNFIKHDILSDPPLNQKFDILISNPPYVRNSEKTLMARNVLDYEPHTALFVDDHDPLIYYRKIFEHIPAIMNSGGKIYLEINESLNEEIVVLMKKYQLVNCRIIMDINQKARIAVAQVA